VPVNQMLRYLAPNLITASALIFGILSITSAMEGRYVDAAWWTTYAVLTDRLDGLVARMVKGTSELGVQLDSLADFMNFGLAPAILLFAVLSGHPALPFADGVGRFYLMAGCAVWVLGATFRLARFNLNADAPPVPGQVKLFFGIPTTLAAGLLIVWLLVFLKYEPAGSPLGSTGSSGAMLLTGFTTPLQVWLAMPAVMGLGGLAMASNLRMPKLGKSRSRAFTAFILINLAVGIPLAFARRYPEVLILQPSMWVVVFLVWGILSKEARAMQPPPIFNPRPPPAPPDDLIDDPA
jgi:CDP-diacylglycerol--serine O-phosphatidyltransferase